MHFAELVKIPKEEFICGNKFIKICEEYKNLGVHFSKIDNWFEELNHAKNSNKKIFITHQGDNPVTQDMINNVPSNIKIWLGANCRAISTKNCNTIGIPLGLNNIDFVACESSRDGKYSSDFSHITNFHENIVEARKFKISCKEKNLAYCNINLSTNIQARSECVRYFKDKLFVTMENPNLSHLDYLKECLSYPFIISPPGNGDDCIRIWESLYLGLIPIVLKSQTMNHFANLPIMIVDSWNQVTEESLENFYKQKNNFIIEGLNISYWKNKIHQLANSL